jgi:YgiT-type zinc finger domain-containing protein
MSCERCGQQDRVSVRRAKVTESEGKVALVLEVPMEECPSCGDRWLSWETAGRLDEMFTSMLESDVEVATRHFVSADQPAA